MLFMVLVYLQVPITLKSTWVSLNWECLFENLCKADDKKYQMEEKKAYPSLSFFKILLDSSASQISIPAEFILRLGERLMGNCKLEANGKWYNVKCEKVDTKYYFTQGWPSFVEANGLKNGYFLVFESNQEASSFTVSVFDSSHTCPSKQHLPASVKRERVKEEPQTDYEKSSNPYTKSEIEDDDDDDFDKRQEDSSDLTCTGFSFSATFKRHNWVAIPQKFAKRTGIMNHRRIMLKDNKGMRWAIDLKPIKDGQLKLTNGWEEFRRASKVDPNVTCIFEFKERYSNVLKVKVVRGRGRPHKQ